MEKVTTDLEDLQSKLLDALIKNSELENEIKRLKAENTKLKSGATRKKKQPSKELLDQAASIYNEYPFKTGRKYAIECIIKALGKESYDVLLEKTKQFAKARRVNGKCAQYTQNPSTWYNQECWTDDPNTWKPKLDTNQSRPKQSYGSGHL